MNELKAAQEWMLYNAFDSSDRSKTVCAAFIAGAGWQAARSKPVVPDGYRLQPINEFDAYSDVLRRIGELELDNAQLQFALEQSESKFLQSKTVVPEGWKLVPVEPPPEMVRAAEEAHMPFGDMDIALRMAILSAPSAPATVQGEAVYRCHKCHAETGVPQPYKLYVKCPKCGETTAATAARTTPPQPAEVGGLVEALKRAREYIASQPVKVTPTGVGGRRGYSFDAENLPVMRVLDRIDAALAKLGADK